MKRSLRCDQCFVSHGNLLSLLPKHWPRDALILIFLVYESTPQII